MPAKNREERIQQHMETCKHFNGMMNDCCTAGINYRNLAGGGIDGMALRLPCHTAFKDRQSKEGIQVIACDLREYPTREEAIAEENDNDASIERFLKSASVAHEDAKSKGLGKGHSGASKCKCPNCETGEIRYSVAGYNGHMHAACTTEGCVSWME